MMWQAGAFGDLCGTSRDDAGQRRSPTSWRSGRHQRHRWRRIPDRPDPAAREVTMTTETTTATERWLSPAVLVGGTFALTTLLNLAFHVGEIVFTDRDPYRSNGP